MKLRAYSAWLILLLLIVAPVFNVAKAQMTSTNYEIRFDSVGAGGDDTSGSVTYQLRDSVGGSGEGNASSATYNLTAGYRQGVFDQIATFETYGMNRVSETAATALTGNVVTVNTVSGVLVGDMAYIVQDQGSNQRTGFGKVIDITGNDVTLDNITTLGGSLTINGSADYFYTANNSTLDLGVLNSSTLSTTALGWTVDADVSGGYSVYVFEDHDLQLTVGPDTYVINDVADGSVSAGASEYGARSSDQTLAGSSFDTTDYNFSTAHQLVGSRSSNSLLNRDFLLIKTGVQSGQEPGNYSHTLTLIYVGAY
ncbi:hypothetical protein COY25_02745 [Candidatus Uhrbacteria bacterium CG_4_10_14_0_2_um_filter_41_7]|uniref:Uncharacterized protein n=1 Tax=Candidatus Uhrbacteria bacterium CG_4_9_14_3_um_filter_41_35 TaxID=1975034 RepID=A0A2M7XGK1_9BACT|nr:MAG: hypothetical protein COY25_02745 [Candidatus Uhrbacteria bacterium CG_4_10_14_0_2_um_filter_41_7]PJA47020.1 MAG: hypothetical protein CO173_00395 [Candidatus Uhrbacteria bacterium CG_4_9_14_3_um_filter_41_35]